MFNLKENNPSAMPLQVRAGQVSDSFKNSTTVEDLFQFQVLNQNDKYPILYAPASDIRFDKLIRQWQVKIQPTSFWTINNF